MKTGTLKELNVKPGDVVEYAGGRRYIVLPDHMLEDEEGDQIHYRCQWKNAPHFTIISRAQEAPASLPSTPELPHGHVTLPDGRTVDLTANRVRCDLMDADELQAMKDHGGPWEFWRGDEWALLYFDPAWPNHVTYRVAPKPVVKTVVNYWCEEWGYCSALGPEGASQKLILTIQDGKIIDTKTEEL